MATLKLEIITPETKIFEGDVDIVHLPGADGEMDVLPQHEVLITELAAGELRIIHQGKTDVLAIGEGFAEITGDSVSVLTDGAVSESDIDEHAAEAAVKRAQEALASATLHGDDVDTANATLARSLAQLHVKRRRRSG